MRILFKRPNVCSRDQIGTEVGHRPRTKAADGNINVTCTCKKPRQQLLKRISQHVHLFVIRMDTESAPSRASLKKRQHIIPQPHLAHNRNNETDDQAQKSKYLVWCGAPAGQKCISLRCACLNVIRTRRVCPVQSQKQAETSRVRNYLRDPSSSLHTVLLVSPKRSVCGIWTV